MLSKTQFIKLFDLSNRDKRRKAVAFCVALLEHIRDAEDDNIDNLPTNFQDSDAFANAEISYDCICDALNFLIDAY
jgi:hypothetical protein